MASGDQQVRWTIEAAPNGETGANALSTVTYDMPYRNFTLAAAPVLDDRTDEFRGTAQPIPPDVTAWNAPDGSASMRLYANQLAPHFLTLLGAPVTTAGDGIIVDPDAVAIPVGATRHVWDSSVIDPATIRSADIKYKYGNNSGVFVRARGVTTTGLTLNLGARGEPSTMDATLTGLYLVKTTDPALTATYDAVSVKPFNRGHFSISTWASGTATPVDSTLTFENPVEQDDAISASLWPVGWTRPNQAGAVPRLTGTIQTKSIDPDDWDTFVNNTSFSYKVKWISTQNIGATAYKYSMWIEGAATYTNYSPEAMEHKLRHQAGIEWQAGVSGATQAFKVTLVNGVSQVSSV